MGTGCNDLCKLTPQVLQVSGEVGVVKKVAVGQLLSAPPPAHSLTLCVSPAGVQLLHCVGPLACRTPDSQRAPSLPPSLAPSLPLRLFCSVPVFLFPGLTQCYLGFNAARRRSAPSAGICKPALQGKKQTHLGSVTVI